MSLTKARELKGKAQGALQKARALNEKTEPLTASEIQQRDGYLNEVDTYMAEARTQERMAGYAESFDEALTPDDDATQQAAEWVQERGEQVRENGQRQGRVPTDGSGGGNGLWVPDANGDFEIDIRKESAAVARASQMEYRKAFNHYMRARGFKSAHATEMENVRTLVEGIDADGGFLAPTQLVAGINREAQDYEELKPRMLNINTNARSLTFTKGLDSIQMGWVPELATKPEDQPTFGRTVIQPHVGAVVTWISDELLEDEQFGLESYISTLVGEGKVLLEEEAFVSGSGAGRPFGLLTRLNAMAGTPQRSTVSVAAGFSGDMLINMVYTQPRRYRRRAAWIMGTDSIRRIRLLREGGNTGNYLWQPGLQAGEPQTILGYPVVESDATALNLGFAAGNDLAVFGDLRRYLVMNRIALQVKRLEELRALTDEVGFRFRFRTGGDTVVNEAFRTLRAIV